MNDCEECGELFAGERSDAAYCSNACRQRAYRRRKKMLAPDALAERLRVSREMFGETHAAALAAVFDLVTADRDAKRNARAVTDRVSRSRNANG